MVNGGLCCQQDVAAALQDVASFILCAPALRFPLWHPQHLTRSPRTTSHSRPPPPHHLCRAKQHLPFLQRAGKVSAVCEYVLSGHRVKVGKHYTQDFVWGTA